VVPVHGCDCEWGLSERLRVVWLLVFLFNVSLSVFFFNLSIVSNYNKLLNHLRYVTRTILLMLIKEQKNISFDSSTMIYYN
jgi:hypothetical protein